MLFPLNNHHQIIIIGIPLTSRVAGLGRPVATMVRVHVRAKRGQTTAGDWDATGADGDDPTLHHLDVHGLLVYTS